MNTLPPAPQPCARTFLGPLAAHAVAHGDVKAIVEETPSGIERSLTYAQLDEAANKIARALSRSGVNPGDCVAWCGRNSTEVLIFQQGARKLGAPAVGLNHQLTAPELARLLEVARPRLVWTDADCAARFGELTAWGARSSIVVSGDEVPEGMTPSELWLTGPEMRGPASTHPDEPATWIMTSGTTGLPKAVVRSPIAPHSCEGRLLAEIWGADPHVVLVSGSISHAGPAGSANRALQRGDTVVIQAKFDAEHWLHLVDKHGVSFSYCAPTIMREVCALLPALRSKYSRDSIRAVVAGAGKWPHSLKLAYQEHFPHNTLWEIYGSSELGSNTVMPPAAHWSKPDSCGRAVAGVEIQLIDSGGEVVKEPNRYGVMYVRSDSLFLTYQGETAEADLRRNGDFMSVGDVAYFDSDGYYYIVGREKDMIKSGGINIYPAEIEAVLDTLDGVLESCVIGVPDDRWGERVHALVVARNELHITPGEVQDYCRGRLASFKVPTVEIVERLPRNAIGKVLKGELRRRYR